MAVYFAPRARLADGWQENVLIATDDQGIYSHPYRRQYAR